MRKTIVVVVGKKLSFVKCELLPNPLFWLLVAMVLSQVAGLAQAISGAPPPWFPD
jgi:hypothetical protein